MTKLEIEITYEPKQESNWKVSYGVPVGCFKTSNRRMAVYYAKRLARNNQPSRIIIHDQSGSVEKQIVYPSLLSALDINDILFQLSVFIVIVVWLLIGPLFLVGVSVYYQLIQLSRYLRERINTLPIIRMSFNKVRGVYHATQNAHLDKPPGTYLLAFVDFFFSPKTVELTFKPLVSDWRTEYFDALHQSMKWKARWISVRYRYNFLKAMGLSKFFSFLRQLVSPSK